MQSDQDVLVAMSVCIDVTFPLLISMVDNYLPHQVHMIDELETHNKGFLHCLSERSLVSNSRGCGPIALCACKNCSDILAGIVSWNILGTKTRFTVARFDGQTLTITEFSPVTVAQANRPFWRSAPLLCSLSFTGSLTCQDVPVSMPHTIANL